MKKQNLEPGFFMRHKNSKYLIRNERSYNIELKNYYSILLDKPIDISIIRLKYSEEFINYLIFSKIDYEIIDKKKL